MTAPEFMTGSRQELGLPGAHVDTGPGPSSEKSFEFDIAIVGLGYVGLPTALAFHAAGRRVLAVDVSQHRLTVISDERADLLASDRDRLTVALSDPGFEMTSHTARLSTAAAVISACPPRWIATWCPIYGSWKVPARPSWRTRRRVRCCC